MLKTLILFLTLTLSFVGLSQTQTLQFNYTGAMQTWIVPQCVTSIQVVAAGAKGGGAVGGNGARITATIAVTPGQTLRIYVGGQGSCGNNSGGWNGGGTGYASNPANATYNSCGGGGATDLRIGGAALANRVIVAGGGGGKGGGSTTTTAGGTANCNNGGKQIAVTLKEKESIENERKDECKDTMCPAVISNDKSCSAIKAVCKNSICELAY